MPRPRPFSADRGFSLVELLIALVFIGLLMAGMAKVYQSSLNTFYVSSETISSGRRNRVALDMVYDDLNATGQYLINLTVYPTIIDNNTNPAFYIIPNRPYTGTDVPTAKALGDELYLYLDDALPFEGTLTAPSAGASFAGSSNAERVANKTNLATLDRSFTVTFADASYASMVKDGQYAIFKDQWSPVRIQGSTVNGKTVRFTTVDEPDNEQGLPTGVNAMSKTRHFAGTGTFTNPTITNPSTGGAPVVFVRGGQMVRYSIRPKFLDPSTPTVALPCLIREQGVYNRAGFIADDSLQTIVAENATTFKVYLSGDGGRTWAGVGLTANDFASGWTNGILPQVNTQLAAVGLPSANNTNDANWFRETPVMVRVDLTTRSAVKRTENAAVANTAEYRERVQSLYLVPRHFGLSFK
ncbi:type II secretion system protein [Geothrix sp. 21YS21S-4]|uniref:type II secretion system protein n=1 Tax=Geothrix sp. 21YS21S-4 TaxID=3068889 RepID=UPI0027BA7D66|nr:type II secretion system protein [Geothrix sp. 21YS21S-4]